VRGDRRLELRDQLGVPARCEVRVEPCLERREPELFQARDLGLRERLVRQVRERRAAPEPKRAAQLPAAAAAGGARRASATSTSKRPRSRSVDSTYRT